MKNNSAHPTLFLLFNHRLTGAQEADAYITFGVSIIIPPPPAITRLWAEIPPDAEAVAPTLAPIRDWLVAESTPGDFILIQGDFGASFVMVNAAFRLGLIPVYATTIRQAVEQHLPDGTVKISHIFSHVRFRRYEQG